MERIENTKGVCITSPAITEVYENLSATGIEKIFGVNYAIANPVYVMSKGRIRADEMAWTDLSEDKINQMLKAVKENSEVAIVYRMCGHKEQSQKSISWLNHEPQVFDLIDRVEAEGAGLDVQVISDGRATDYYLVRKVDGKLSLE
jgi:hypothetical protein